MGFIAWMRRAHDRLFPYPAVDAGWVGHNRGPALDFVFGGKNWPGLAKLQEESAEVNQVLAKLIQTGGDPAHWSGDMIDKLVEELPDLLAALRVFIELNPVLLLHGADMVARYDSKVAQFRAWHFDTLAARGG